MNRYETILILDKRFTETDYTIAAENLRDLVHNQLHTNKIKTELLGKKRLSYPIHDCNEGWYILFTYDVESAYQDHITDLERHLRINTDILKFLTVKCENTGDDIPDCYVESEQPDNKHIDAMDVLLGLADYNKKAK